MNFGVNKPKIFDVQTTSFAEILLVILFFLLIFNIDAVEKVTGKDKEISVLTEKVKTLEEVIDEKNKKIEELKKEIIAWKRKLILVNKENIKLRNENNRIKLELAKVKKEKDKINKELDKYRNKYGKLDGDDVVNYCRIGKNNVFPVLNIIATNKKFIITPLWDKMKDVKDINVIPGLNRINKKLIINHNTFKKYFTPTYLWGKKPENNCRFKVRLKMDKSIKKASVFDYVSNEVGRHFYKIRVK
jgi:regulator of replication initiation timing